MASAVHASQPSYVLALAIIFMILCPTVVGLRFYTRLAAKQNASIGVDDLLMIPATLLTIGCAIVLIVGVRVGVFAHPVSDANLDFFYDQKLQWAFLLMHIPSLGCVKLSFVLFFRRIFCLSRFRTAFEITSALVAILIVVWATAFFFWFLFSCSTHFDQRWTSVDTYLQWCGDDDISDLGLSISDFLTDVIVLVLPIPMVWKLHMTLRRKILVTGVFALGLVALVVSTIRMVFFVYIISFTNVGNLGILHAGAILASDSDNNLLTTETLYWSLLEQGLALVACCLPTLNGLFNTSGLRSIAASARSLRTLGSDKNATRKTSQEPYNNALLSKSFVGRGDSLPSANIELQPQLPGSTRLGTGKERSIEQASESV